MRKITPKRRNQILKPSNLRAYIKCFIRRDSNASPVQLGTIVDRYLEDTKTEGLREDEKAMASLRTGLIKAMLDVWDIQTGDDDLVLQAQLLAFRHKGDKAWFTIPSGTVLNMGSGFSHKELCDMGTLTAGSACVFSCTYCSVGATLFQSPHTAILRLLEIEHREAVIRRLDPVKTLRAQLTFKNGKPRFKGKGKGTAVLSPLVESLASKEFLEESLEIILLIMELTDWDVRVLTKSTRVKKLATLIPVQYRHRIIYGLSIGILDDNVSMAVEQLTSKPSLRLEAYRWLQEQGLRTYCMHCPVPPQGDYLAYAERLAAATNWEQDEHVWIEALNSRGKSDQLTLDALRAGGFHQEADLLVEATRSRTAWEHRYNRPLFEAMASVCPREKLRYLVYASGEDRDFWLKQRNRGALVLGEESGGGDRWA